MVYSPEISSTVSHTGPLETDSSPVLFACVLTEVVARGIGPTFPPQHWNATLALLLEPEQMPHPLKKLGSYCATNRKSSVDSHAYTHVTMHEYA